MKKRKRRKQKGREGGWEGGVKEMERQRGKKGWREGERRMKAEGTEGGGGEE